MPQGIETTSISYEKNCPMEPNAWDREAYSISIFRNMNFLDTDTKNIEMLLLYMANFIGNRKLNKDHNLIQLNRFGHAAWCFISSIYKAGWDSLRTNDNRMFRQNIASKFTPKVNSKVNDNINKSKKKNDQINTNKQVEVTKIPPSIPLRLSKETLEKSKFHKKQGLKTDILTLSP